MFYFYILRCKDNSLYSGQTNDLEKRVKEHESNDTKSAKYTRTRRPVKLVYFESFSSRVESMRREREVKSWKKKRKEKMVKDFILSFPT